MILTIQDTLHHGLKNILQCKLERTLCNTGCCTIAAVFYTTDLLFSVIVYVQQTYTFLGLIYTPIDIHSRRSSSNKWLYMWIAPSGCFKMSSGICRKPIEEYNGSYYIYIRLDREKLSWFTTFYFTRVQSDSIKDAVPL